MADKKVALIYRCPNCGASDVSLDAAQGKLKCNYCKTVSDEKTANDVGGVDVLSGETVFEGAEDIVPSDNVIVTMKCPSCGAETTMTAEEALGTTCHWCRHVLTSGEKIKNGAVPDLVLPFKISRRDAEAKVRDYVRSQAGLNAEFLGKFDEKQIEGVYFPYFIVDVKAESTLAGMAEKNIGSATYPPFKAERYKISREFNLEVDDLTVEASSNLLNQDTYVNSNNVINSVMPFDAENCVEWNPNLLRGFRSEKRDVNTSNLKEMVALQCGDVARKKAKETIAQYDRGVCWMKEHLSVKGAKWKTAYFPVWLYSFKWSDGRSNRIFYVALNARTGEISGELPTGADGNSKRKAPALATFFCGLGVFLFLMICRALLRALGLVVLPGLLSMIGYGALFVAIIGALIMSSLNKQKKRVYKNVKAIATRHYHEEETKATVKNIKKTDDFVKSGSGIYTSEINGRNDSRVIGSASVGRNAMLESELRRFSMGQSYTNARQASAQPTSRSALTSANSYYSNRARQLSKNVGKGAFSGFLVWIIIIVIVLFVIGASGGSGGSSGGYSSGGYSSYDSDYDYDYDSGSSWDWGSSSDWDSDWDSGWDSDWDSGFDYDW